MYRDQDTPPTESAACALPADTMATGIADERRKEEGERRKEQDERRKEDDERRKEEAERIGRERPGLSLNQATMADGGGDPPCLHMYVLAADC